MRSIDVQQGEQVKAGQVLARLDPTFAAADLERAGRAGRQPKAQVARLQAEVDGKPFTYTGLDPRPGLAGGDLCPAAGEYNYKLENYKQKIEQPGRHDGARAVRRRRLPRPAGGGAECRADAQAAGKAAGRQPAQHAAGDGQPRGDGAHPGQCAEATAEGAQRDLAALVAERDMASKAGGRTSSQQLADASSKLSDAQQSLNKAQLRRQLVELRAEHDATVLSVAKVSVGSVLQSGQQFITLVPTDAPLEVEANIPGPDNGFVHVGDPVTIKFDTFPYRAIRHGARHGADHQPRQLHRARRPAQPDQRAAAAGGPQPSRIYRARITIDQIELHDTPRGFHLCPACR